MSTIYISDHESALRELGKEYFIHDLQFVPDISSWAKANAKDLTEPHAPMKLITKGDDTLSMVVQAELSEKKLNDVLKNLSVRRALQDTTFDTLKTLNSTRKLLAFCFLKEYARTLSVLGQDEQLEDSWVLDEMKTLGYFDE